MSDVVLAAIIGGVIGNVIVVVGTLAWYILPWRRYR